MEGLISFSVEGNINEFILLALTMASLDNDDDDDDDKDGARRWIQSCFAAFRSSHLFLICYYFLVILRFLVKHFCNFIIFALSPYRRCNYYVFSFLHPSPTTLLSAIDHSLIFYLRENQFQLLFRTHERTNEITSKNAHCSRPP